MTAELNPRKENYSSPGWKSKWMVYEKNGNYMYCPVRTAWRLGNLMEWTKEAQCQNFQNTMLTLYVGLLEHKMALKGSEIRKTSEEAQRKGITKQNKAILVLFKCVQWLCMASIPLVKFKLLLELLHDSGLNDIGYQSKTWSWKNWIQFWSCTGKIVQREGQVDLWAQI